MKNSGSRYFGRHDSAVRNGSSVVIVVKGVRKAFVNTFMNGDHMDTEYLSDGVNAVARTAEKLVADGLREYSQEDFKRLSPACMGGKGMSA